MPALGETGIGGWREQGKIALHWRRFLKQQLGSDGAVEEFSESHQGVGDAWVQRCQGVRANFSEHPYGLWMVSLWERNREIWIMQVADTRHGQEASMTYS